MASTSSNEAIPKNEVDTAGTLEERLKAWKHVVGNLQEYVEQHETLHKSMAKEFEKVGKTVSEPLKEAAMFTQETGGIQSYFDNIRSNNQALALSHLEASKALKSGVLPQLERLHAEIKAKVKELNHGVTKGTKAVAKSREGTKKHIDELAKLSSQFDSTGGGASKLHDPVADPYIVRRGVLHRLHKQVMDENAQRQDLLSVQQGFRIFEVHVIQSIQAAMNAFYQVVGGQAEKVKALYGDIVGAATRLPLDYEWNGFVQRYGNVLIDPCSPNRDVASLTFPNMNHVATKPLIEGSLQRKGKILGRYNTAYYVLTKSRYLHEFGSNDEHNVKDPEPSMSLYLPECKIGALTPAPDAKFTLSGKDANKHQKLTREHEFVFKAASNAEAKEWWDLLAKACGVTTDEIPAPTRENSLQTTGTVGETPPVYEEKGKKDLAVRTNTGVATVIGDEFVQSPVEK